MRIDAAQLRSPPRRNSLRSLRPVIAALYRPLVYTPSDLTSLLE